MPAPSYPTARAIRTAAARIEARSSAASPGAGASSSTFWWRRWSEQSRSPRWSDAPVGVGEDLDLDVPGGGDVALDDQAIVPEGAAGLPPGGLEGRLELVAAPDDPDALAAAARGRLDEERQPDPVGRRGKRCVRLVVGLLAGRDRDVDAPGRLAGPGLVAERADRVRRRADPGEAGRDHRLGQDRALGQEAVPRVDRVGAGRERRPDDVGRVEQVDGIRGAWPDLATVRADGTSLGVTGASDQRHDRDDPEPVRGRRDPRGDLPAVRDEQDADGTPSSG